MSKAHLLVNAYLNKEFLIQKYAKEGLSCNQIDELAGVSSMTVHRALVRYGISRRGYEEGRLLRRKKKHGAVQRDTYDPRIDEMYIRFFEDLGFWE